MIAKILTAWFIVGGIAAFVIMRAISIVNPPIEEVIQDIKDQTT